MREKYIEQRIVKAVREAGGRAMKFVSPGMIGVPDRLVLMDGRAFFVEVKAPGKKPRRSQMVVQKMLQDLGFKTYNIDSVEQIAPMVEENRKHGI